LSGSDSSKSWPVAERRGRGDRRKGSERRATDPAGAPAPATGERRSAERRRGHDRRSEGEWQPVSLEFPSGEAADSAQALLAAAADARRHAQARYSHFAVGAALETDGGEAIGGCNIENATFGLTLCAERVALVKALSEGRAVFTRIAVVADTDALTPPCGPCRQLLWEYCGDIDIILGNLTGATARYRLSTLLPLPFDARLLG
jgi:cytidine deaminase